MSKRKTRFRFSRFLLIYALVLLLLGAAALFVLNLYLRAFEATRPATAMAAYFETLTAAGGDDACRAALSGLDTAVQSEEEGLAFVSELLREADYAELAGGGEAELKRYRLRSGGEALGTVTLRRGGETRMGLTGWEVSGEVFDFSPWMEQGSVTVPADCRVCVGDALLGPGNVADDAVPYEALRECYEHFEDMPRMLRYEWGPCLGELPLRVLDAQGRELSGQELNEAAFLDNCDEQTKTALRDFAGEFVRCYVAFTAAVEQDFEDSYPALARLLLPGSPLHERLSRAAYDKWWSNTRSCTLEELNVNLCTDLGNGSWLIDLSYVTRTVAFAEPVVEQYNLRLVVQDFGGRLRASNLYNY